MNTVKEHILMGHKITAFCRPCERNVELDLEAIMKAKGPAYRISDNPPCGKCGGKDTGITVAKRDAGVTTAGTEDEPETRA